MSSDNFFAKIASIDPIAQALHLPGYNTDAKAQANAHLPGSSGPYSGIAPTLAGANAGYAPGGPGSNPMWRQPQPWHQGGLFGALQGGASQFGNIVDVGGNTPLLPTTSPSFNTNFSNASPAKTGPVGQVSPYSAAAAKAGGLYG